VDDGQRRLSATQPGDSVELLGPRQSVGGTRSFAVAGIRVRRLRLDLSNWGHVAPAAASKIDEARAIAIPNTKGTAATIIRSDV
jgi:hypothetical protein